MGTLYPAESNALQATGALRARRPAILAICPRADWLYAQAAMANPSELCASFLAAVDEPQRAGLAAIADLGERLARIVAEARAAWPGVGIADERFMGHLAARMPALADPADPFAGLRTADLLLACGCCHGDAGALAAFMAGFGADIEAVARRFHSLPVDRDDVLQVVRERLLVGPPPRIADYAGLGFLQNWVRIAAVRAFLDAGRRRSARPEVGDHDALAAIADPNDDVELAYLKRHYRGEFKRAFAEAVAALSSRERNLLRQHLVGGLTIDQMAALYGIHRATAARRVAAARAALLQATRARLAARLRIDDGELGSIMRLIHSQLDISIVRVLHRTAPGTE
jgi:RNA polymerase sigma-70 factor, ECF subfamily